ncbi:MAG: hypothetical protein M1813_006130 [Trichoglossum hirsutum]|nr:MAG: hypothetical protein M1813_006130 [Trichoglossum hirsutum]
MAPPPPPVTPSPHRFVTPKQQGGQPKKGEAGPAAAGRQFNRVPRFHYSSTPATGGSSETASKNTHNAAAAYMFSSPLVARGVKRGKERVVEGIEMSSDCGEDDDDGEKGGAPVMDGEGEEEVGWSEGGRKRRRISNSSGGMDEGGTLKNISSPPSTPPPSTSSFSHHPIPRFIFPPPPPPPAGTTPITTYAHSLVAPPAPSQAQAPPDVLLSPQRNPKFLPGGLASEVRSWVVGASVAPRGGGGGGGGGEGVGVKVLGVREGWGAGVLLVVGSMGEEGDGDGDGDGERVLLLLVGHGGVKGVQEGAVIRVREPAWDILLQGTRWRVCADWRLDAPSYT